MAASTRVVAESVFRLLARFDRAYSFRCRTTSRTLSTLGRTQFGVGPTVTKALQRTGIREPSLIQRETLPLALAGYDVLCCAQTGSGKTLTFLLPILQRLFERRANAISHVDSSTKYPSEPEALVLVPTRELAMQITRVARGLAEGLPEPPVILQVTGGEQFTPQKRALLKGDVRLVVATPERLLYHVEEGNMSLRRVRLVALDEADTLLCAADGLTRETDVVLQALPKRKPPQVLLAAATMSAEHEKVVRNFFPKIQRVSHPGVLVPTLQKR